MPCPNQMKWMLCQGSFDALLCFMAFSHCEYWRAFRLGWNAEACRSFGLDSELKSTFPVDFLQVKLQKREDKIQHHRSMTRRPMEGHVNERRVCWGNAGAPLRTSGLASRGHRPPGRRASSPGTPSRCCTCSTPCKAIGGIRSAHAGS
ncbi:hypothetical protein B296_00048428 [Ensete ventricosum]|uniref:Uncharacterized protein n=1 Tax=Ensete ventricosum TaxID=4639 RepID=A0A426YLY9_ENSVE|nr:hypothetical protein B296_00048428 [Ensete ventricosum]